MNKLPWICPKHPNAKIKCSWDETHYVMNGFPVGEGRKSNFMHQCSICGLELAATKEESNDKSRV